MAGSADFTWENGKLIKIVRNNGSVYQFAYTENGFLESITFPDDDDPKLFFRYEDSRFPTALTGVTDEVGKI